MQTRHIAAFAVLLSPLALAACAGQPQLYPQPYIGTGAAPAVSPQTTAEFKARTLHTPAEGKVRDLGEAYIATSLDHPSSARFTGEFESIGKSPALCGFVSYKDRSGAMSGWRPFFVEWTQRVSKGSKKPYDYNAETELAKLCGPMTPPAP
ncbi:MAG TPA: hypothetical protein VL752_19680 [Acidisoma sp.]|uniref:hypothetical protein n=1 Tax=Acidisoma sp. TaxID=1872115 RepID=UPI002CAD17D6|nr:hypothetical protein [Acidisoma sp.]HTI03174.1 hypothetical protein [Acidisoma sp.]